MNSMLAGLLPEALVIDLPEVDAQHEEIFGRIEALKDACLESGDALLEELESLGDFFAHHFATEERIAEQAGLDFSEHAKMHRTSLRIFNKAMGELRRGARDGYSFMRYIELWFERHILEYDQPFAACVRPRKRYRPASMQISASF